MLYVVGRDMGLRKVTSRAGLTEIKKPGKNPVFYAVTDYSAAASVWDSARSTSSM